MDIDDDNRWRATYGSKVGYYGDATGDFEVDAADYIVWRDNLSQPAGSGSLTNGEPQTSVLLTLAVAGWCLRRGRPA